MGGFDFAVGEGFGVGEDLAGAVHIGGDVVVEFGGDEAAAEVQGLVGGFAGEDLDFEADFLAVEAGEFFASGVNDFSGLHRSADFGLVGGRCQLV